jgi:hypothetical protein
VSKEKNQKGKTEKRPEKKRAGYSFLAVKKKREARCGDSCCNPSIWEAEARGSEPTLYREALPQKKKQK